MPIRCPLKSQVAFNQTLHRSHLRMVGRPGEVEALGLKVYGLRASELLLRVQCSALGHLRGRVTTGYRTKMN